MQEPINEIHIRPNTERKMESVAETFAEYLNLDHKKVFSLDSRVDPLAFLVGQYYAFQKTRIMLSNAASAFKRDGRPNTFPFYLSRRLNDLEELIGSVIKSNTPENQVQQWLQSVKGIGPIFAAGLMAKINPEKIKSPSSLQYYCGLTPQSKRVRGQKCNYDPFLKTHLFKIGDSFLKLMNDDSAFYGRLFREYLKQERDRNELGDFQEQAKEALANKNWSEDSESKDTYESGMLPKGHVLARARRRVLKVFISHLAQVYYESYYPDQKIPRPYVFEHLGHVHEIKCPNWPLHQQYSKIIAQHDVASLDVNMGEIEKMFAERRKERPPFLPAIKEKKASKLKGKKLTPKKDVNPID
jgi:hypothetical protein